MKPDANKAPADAFMKLATWQRAYRTIAGKLGVTVTNGDIADLAGSGQSVRFSGGTSSSDAPFNVSGSSTLRVNGGCIFYGGRVFYIPEASYAAGTTYTIGITFDLGMYLAAHGGGSPWDAYILHGTDPYIQVRALGSVGTNLTLKDTLWDSSFGATEALTQADGDLFFPLAIKAVGWDRVQLWRGHLNLELMKNGRPAFTDRYPYNQTGYF